MAPTPTTTSQFPLRLPRDTYETLRAEANASGRSINTVINEIVEEHLRTHRSAIIAKIGQAASDRYAVVLDKLKDL